MPYNLACSWALRKNGHVAYRLEDSKLLGSLAHKRWRCGVAIEANSPRGGVESPRASYVWEVARLPNGGGATKLRP